MRYTNQCLEMVWVIFFFLYFYFFFGPEGTRISPDIWIITTTPASIS